MDTAGEGKGKTSCESSTDVSSASCVKQAVGSCSIAEVAQLGDALEGWDGRKAQKGGDVCIQTADSVH